MIVAAAVIERDGYVLIAKRKQGWHEAGKWEFPGGTLEEGETPEQCLKRELQEELAIVTEVGALFCKSEYSYTPDWTIRLMVYLSSFFPIRQNRLFLCEYFITPQRGFIV